MSCQHKTYFSGTKQESRLYIIFLFGFAFEKCVIWKFRNFPNCRRNLVNVGIKGGGQFKSQSLCFSFPWDLFYALLFLGVWFWFGLVSITNFNLSFVDLFFFSFSILGSNEPPRKSMIQSHSHSHSWNQFSLSISESFQNCLICSFWLETAIQSVGPSVRLSVREFVLLIIYFWYIVSGFSFFGIC